MRSKAARPRLRVVGAAQLGQRLRQTGPPLQRAAAWAARSSASPSGMEAGAACPETSSGVVTTMTGADRAHVLSAHAHLIAQSATITAMSSPAYGTERTSRPELRQRHAHARTLANATTYVRCKSPGAVSSECRSLNGVRRASCGGSVGNRLDVGRVAAPRLLP